MAKKKKENGVEEEKMPEAEDGVKEQKSAKKAKEAPQKTEGEKKETKKAVKKAVKEKEAEAKQGSDILPYAVVALGIIVIVAGILVMMMPRGDGGSSDEAQIIASALASTKGAMDLAEQANNFTISKSEGEVIFENDSRIVKFPIEGSDDYKTFDVVLNEELGLRFIGLNSIVVTPEEFMRLQQGPNTFQTCAKIFNEQAIIPNLIGRWANGTATQRHILTIPRTINCSGTSYPYRLEISDGYVKTTINGYYYRHGFQEGIVVNELDIPEEDIAKGVFVYVDRPSPGKLRYSYELRDESVVTFDAYSPSLLKDYNIESVPRLIWNCKFALARTLATAELAGQVPAGTEMTVLSTLTCIYNNGHPEELCSQLGVAINETGGIEAQIPTEYLFSMYEVGEESCKPNNDTVLLQAFHKPGSQASEDQRIILEALKENFGDHLDLQYYCADEEDICRKLVESRE